MGLITEEVYLFKAFIEKTLKAIRFVPSPGKDIKRDLSAYRIRESIVSKFLAENVDEFDAKIMLLQASRCIRVDVE